MRKTKRKPDPAVRPKRNRGLRGGRMVEEEEEEEGEGGGRRGEFCQTSREGKAPGCEHLKLLGDA
jgi:hypothetical protein